VREHIAVDGIGDRERAVVGAPHQPQIEGQAAHHYKAGDAVYEPANARILHYDNESKTEPAVLIANYLAGADDHALITLLSK